MSSEETDVTLTKLQRRFKIASERQPLKKNCDKKLQELQGIWSELRGLRIYVGSGHYGEVEGLRLRILREVALLDSVLFSELRKELRDDHLSAVAEIHWLVIKATTFPTRLVDHIDRRARRAAE